MLSLHLLVQLSRILVRGSAVATVEEVLDLFPA
jgi:hypothetical protein